MTLIAILVATVAALAAALFGMGAVAGPDVGWAGAGLWFVMAPAAALSMIGAFLIGRSVTFERAFQRRVAFVLTSTAISFFLGAASAWGFDRLMHVDEPEFVFVPSPHYSATITISAPPGVQVDDTLRVATDVAGGPWVKVPYKDLHLPRYRDVAGYHQPEPPRPKELIRVLFWETEPWSGTAGLTRGDADSAGVVPVVFHAPGTFTLFARLTMPALARSNGVTVIVTPRSGR